MTYSPSRKGSLDVASFPNPGLRKPSIISLDGFKSPSPLPAMYGGIENVYQLAKSIQTNGSEVISYVAK